MGAFFVCIDNLDVFQSFSNLESRISNLESRISNLESRISNLELPIRHKRDNRAGYH